MRALETAKNADQVELIAFQNGYAPISEGLADEEFSGEFEDLAISEIQNQDDWMGSDTFSDTELGLIKKEIENRAKLLTESYPFNLNESSLSYSDTNRKKQKIYEALLLISTNQDRSGRQWQEVVDEFEKLSVNAVEKFFQCSKTWWTGANSESKFKEIIDNIHKHTGELEWNPDPKVIENHKKIKDAGVDFINYRQLTDNRAGGLFFFGQSACGQDWFNKTTRDLRENKYGRIFRKPYAEPVKIFVIPYLVNEATMIKAFNNLSGLVFDRAVLTSLFLNDVAIDGIKDNIQEFFEFVWNKFD